MASDPTWHLGLHSIACPLLFGELLTLRVPPERDDMG